MKSKQTGDVAIIVAIVVWIALIAVLLWLSVQEARRWEAFKVAHHCKVVGEQQATTSVGFAPSGNGVTTVIVTDGGKTGWLCDNGVTYWRNK